MNESSSIPTVPRLLQRLALPVPPFALTPLVARLVRQTVADHPELFDRLGEHAGKCFDIDPTDLPFVIRLHADPAYPRSSVHRRAQPGWDCRIAGSFAALVGMVHGAYDGDALFFSRDIVIEGDTAAGLALRNAIDNAELDLFSQATDALGAFGRTARPGLSRAADILERRTGVALRRVEI